MSTPELPDGFRIGHWDDPVALTGCTVVLCPPQTIGGVEVRGSSPGSRELALLGSEKSMQEVHAVLLTGGSAFGLAAADGVMKFLEEQGVGYRTPWAAVPIVPAAVVFDLNVGSNKVRPVADSGYGACQAAGTVCAAQGNVGAGMGATVGKWAGTDSRMKGGFGVASARHGDLIVSVAAVVNAVGDVLDAAGRVLAGARSRGQGWLVDGDPWRTFRRPVQQSNTTLIVVMTNARLSKVEANRLAARGNDGMARAIRPVHTSFDGDAVFSLAAGGVNAPFDLIAEIATEVVAGAIRSSVLHARSVDGAPGLAAGPVLT